jgi:hypothetical protein
MKRTPMKRSAPLRNSTTATTKVKPKACAKARGGCGAKFIPARPMQCACSQPCAQAFVAKANAKKAAKAAADDKRKTKAQLEALKTLPTLAKECEKEMNRWVRLRDWHLGCISCGKPFNPDQIGGSCDAGHYRSKGSAKHLRFDERNLHGQCKHCNDYLAGNPTGYRRGLIVRIGPDEVEALEADQAPRKYTRQDLREKRDFYRAEANALAKAGDAQRHGECVAHEQRSEPACVARTPQKVLPERRPARGRGAAEIDSFSPPMNCCLKDTDEQ